MLFELLCCESIFPKFDFPKTEENKYAEKYKTSNKKIVKIGANFSTKTRTLTEWKIE